MVMYIKSSLVTALEKENATHIIQQLIAQQMCKDISLNELVTELIQIVNVPRQTGRC